MNGTKIAGMHPDKTVWNHVKTGEWKIVSIVGLI